MWFKKLFGSEKKENPNDFGILKKFVFLSNLKKKDLILFRNMLMERNFADGEYIFKENYPHAVLYLIIKGEIEILLDNEVVATLQPFSHFGEIGLFIESKRTASARAKGQTLLYACSKNDFSNFIDTFNSIGIKILYNFGINFSNTIIKNNDKIKSLENKLISIKDR
ncbi:MAG: cyclic nucleotide-binding domain-containing protein [Candidatus Cloacimonetes bacterium]|nr:cyclic nucleotide-binding domain-containing protein [Candidatus Cloacimonadota bacterium]